MSTRGYESFTATDVAQMQAKRAKPSKYRAVKTVVDGITFDSKKEAQRYHELKLMEKAGLIRGLVLQPSYPLDAFGVECRPIGIYRGDFAYELAYAVNGVEHWRPVLEDVKGFKTPLYRWKKKHVEAQYGIEIREA